MFVASVPETAVPPVVDVTTAAPTVMLPPETVPVVLTDPATVSALVDGLNDKPAELILTA